MHSLQPTPVSSPRLQRDTVTGLQAWGSQSLLYKGRQISRMHSAGCCLQQNTLGIRTALLWSTARLKSCSWVCSNKLKEQ